jgi:hypothetical protein
MPTRAGLAISEQLPVRGNADRVSRVDAGDECDGLIVGGAAR